MGNVYLARIRRSTGGFGRRADGAATGAGAGFKGEGGVGAGVSALGSGTFFDCEEKAASMLAMVRAIFAAGAC